jgi:hypothetical protein
MALTRVRKASARGWPFLLAVLALVAGWAGSSWFNHGPTTQLRIEGQIQGVVSSVNYNGSGICIRSDSDTQEHCSQPMQVPGSAPLKTGDHVVVTVALVDVGGGASVEVFIVTSPPPSHG